MERGTGCPLDGHALASPPTPSFAPAAPPLGVSPSVPDQEMCFIEFPAGWTGPAHPSPARQWMFVMTGHGETTASGETRPWGRGDALRLEDTYPPGHMTSVFEHVVFAVVRSLMGRTSPRIPGQRVRDERTRPGRMFRGSLPAMGRSFRALSTRSGCSCGLTEIGRDRWLI